MHHLSRRGISKDWWDVRLDFLDSNAEPDKDFSGLTYYLWSYSRSISLNDWAIAEFDIPIPTSSPSDRELRTMGISDTHITRRNFWTYCSREETFVPPTTNYRIFDRGSLSHSRNTAYVEGRRNIFVLHLDTAQERRGTRRPEGGRHMSFARRPLEGLVGREQHKMG